MKQTFDNHSLSITQKTFIGIAIAVLAVILSIIFAPILIVVVAIAVPIVLTILWIAGDIQVTAYDDKGDDNE